MRLRQIIKTTPVLRHRSVLALVVGLMAGACLPGLIAHFARKEPVPSPAKAAASEMIITEDSLLPTMAGLARDREWRTQADFEQRFKGYKVSPLPEGLGLRGSPPLSFENERYLSVLLRREDPVIHWTAPPITDPKVLSDPDFHPRRDADGKPILRQDVSMPKAEIWYLLAAFNKSNDLCNWWCVFVSP